MNYKQEIEKTALNAQKARRMAQEAGIFPEGAWKFALRKSRNMKTGELLKGKELADAHKKLGKIPNNEWNYIKAFDRKFLPRTEIGGVIKNTGIKGHVGEYRKGTVPMTLNSGEKITFHTHPDNVGEGRFLSGMGKDILEENKIRFGKKRRNPLYADLSGEISAKGNKTNLNKQQINQRVTSTKNKLHKLERQKKSFEKYKFDAAENYRDGKIDEGILQIKSKVLGDYKNNRVRPNYNDITNNINELNLLRTGVGGDSSMREYYKDINHNVLATKQDIEGVHKFNSLSSKNAKNPPRRTVRSIYFDRTPRKSR